MSRFQCLGKREGIDERWGGRDPTRGCITAFYDSRARPDPEGLNDVGRIRDVDDLGPVRQDGGPELGRRMEDMCMAFLLRAVPL
jgi:hypothetical protein